MNYREFLNKLLIGESSGGSGGSGDMTKAEFATNGNAGYVDYAMKAKVADTASEIGDVSAAQIGLMAGQSHYHANKSTLDKLAETDGKLTYDGEEIGGGSGTVKSVNGQTPDSSGAVTIPNATTDAAGLMSQIDKNYLADAYRTMHSHSNPSLLEMLGLSEDLSKLTLNGKEVGGSGDMTKAEFATNGNAGYVDYAMKAKVADTASEIGDVSAAQIGLMAGQSHYHANKTTLDKLAETDGKLTYDGEEIGGGGGSLDGIDTADIMLKSEYSRNGITRYVDNASFADQAMRLSDVGDLSSNSMIIGTEGGEYTSITLDDLKTKMGFSSDNGTVSSDAYGWFKLPSGTIVQWGSKQVSLGWVLDDKITITYPVSFQTGCRSIVGSVGRITGSSPNEFVLSFGAAYNTNATCRLYSLADSTTVDDNDTYINWIAIGY